MSKKSKSPEKDIYPDMNDISWSILDKYFTQDPNHLVRHHLDSYNNFYKNGIFNIFKENNPIRFLRNIDNESNGKDINEIKIYLGKKDGKSIYFGKPIIYDESNDKNIHYMYPNDARLRNMTYAITIHYDIEVEYIYHVKDESQKNVKIENTIVHQNIYLGRFPIMLQSDLCILSTLPPEIRYNMGECRNDYGGYFIIDGKEKSIVPQEKFGNNMIYIKKLKDDKISFSAEIRSVSEDTSKPIRTLSIQIIRPNSVLSNNQIVVNVPNVKKPVPLFILMRALGVISDKEIIQHCLLDLDKNNNYLDLFIPSVHDAGKIFTQQAALEYISVLTKRRTINGVLYILMDLLLPHIGENNFIDKSFFIGNMVFKLLNVFIGINKPTDRDNYKFKRIELTGDLIHEVFREYYLIQCKNIGQKIDKEYYFKSSQYDGENFMGLIDNNISYIFKDRIVEDGLRKAYKGNWGSEVHTKRVGIVQDLNRLSYFTFLSQLRKIVLPLDSTSKVVGPRLLNSSQWGYMDPIDTPDGANIGLHKHLSITTFITSHISSNEVIQWLTENTIIHKITECNYQLLSISTKVFVNGIWFGVILSDPITYIESFKLYRRNGIIPIYISISFDFVNNEIHIFSDSGRLMRPIYYIDKTTGTISYERFKDLNWGQVVSGFHKKVDDYNHKNNLFYNLTNLYSELQIESLKNTQAIVDYIDTSEEEGLLIAKNREDIINRYYTNVEMLPSLILGVMGNLIIFAANNPVTRNAFSCGQSKQAVSLFHTNYQMRMDKMSVILNNGQIPLVKSKYLKYINNEEQPYGVNTIVAIMSYTGYNVEDAILINKGSVERGLFSTTYYTTYESKEESATIGNSDTNSVFSDLITKNVIGLKPGYDYTKIDKYGLVKEGTEINDNVVVIGKYNYSSENPSVLVDSSVFTKKGQLGIVDKSFITEGEEGFRIAKIRIREERKPAIGDKMASRAGQKGTIGLLIPEEDMPYTSDGIRPDIIINPHAIPSRMTLGQLIETILGKICLYYGGFGDCTAFETQGPHTELYGDLLVRANFHSSGNQLMYSGFTGEQIDSEIYMGPTYYMRLKHMVKDKINYRARGPNTALTRQPVQGRANDGGLRIGEMERDGVMGHGCSAFLNDSFMTRGDEYYMAICNKSGGIAIYNKELNLFLSPFADGPIQFKQTINNVKKGETLNIENISKFGRSFSIVRVPYSFKLLIQEVQAMNIQMKIITENNIDQLLSMGYSDNIQTLLHRNDEDLKTVLASYKHKLTNIINNPGYKPSKFIKTSLKDLIDQDKSRRSIITSMDDAIEVGKRCLNYIKKNVKNQNPVDYDLYPDKPSYKDIYSTDMYSLENTMKYIFEVLHHSCYFLCVYGGDKDHFLYKLVSGTTSPIIDREFKKSFKQKLKINDKSNPEVRLNPKQIKDIEKTLDAPYRTMSCIIKPFREEDKKSYEYETLLKSIVLPSGIYIFNLNDSMILKQDFTFPWNIFKPVSPPLSTFGITPKFIPIFSISGQDGYLDIPIPNYDDIGIHDISKFHTEWEEKIIMKAVFRGGPTGCGYTTMTNPRLQLLNMVSNPSEEIPEDIIQLLNVAIVMPDGLPGKSINTNSVKNDPVYGIGVMNTSLLSGEKMSMADQSEYKYIIHIDGNVNAYRLLTTMLTGSVILRVKSPYMSWFEHMIHGFDMDTPEDIQNKHFIWIKEDLSNLFSVIQWCNKNESICKILSKQCLKLAHKISSPEYILQYTQMMIWASVEGTVMSSEKRSLDHNTDLNISSELEEVLPEVDDLSLINPQQITVPYFEKSYNPTSPVYSPGDWGISTPEGPPPGVYTPRSPEGPPPGVYTPRSPEGPPPGVYTPRSPDGPPPGVYTPRSPDGPPPGVYTPPTPPPPSNMSGQEVTKILEDINEKLDELKEPKEEEEDEDILKIKEPKEEESSKGGGGETKKIKIN
jgi:DNA-directed RNA polymerase II subunit RPB2